MSGGFILVVMDVMVVWVAYCTASMIVAVVNGKLRSSLKWSWPNRGIISVFAWRN
jgi:hypothetical protein